MATPKSNQPINWFDSQYGGSPRQGSVGSAAARVQFEDDPTPGTPSRLDVPRHYDETGRSEQDLRRRRSSISMRINSLAQAGGVNSIENFARSWQRAVGFYEITPASTPRRGSDHQVVEGERRPIDAEHGPKQNRSLLRQQLEQEGSSPEAAIQDEPSDQDSTYQISSVGNTDNEASTDRGKSIFSQAPYLASPFADSYGGTYGSLASRANESSMRHAGQLFREQQAAGVQEPDKERVPLFVKRVEREDGTVVNVVVGQSTLPQTVFNSVNVLIGVGLLSLPLGIKYAGWLIGLIFLILSAIITAYTARLLAKCADVDDSLITFADLAFVSFGTKARFITSILFTIELIAACVALVVLFADSLDALVPGWGIVEWKIACGVILIPLCFTPLRLLSITSVLGILCCLGIVIFVFVDGAIKSHAPGSLREPAMTSLYPAHWGNLPLSFGILMSPWGGHSVFPNIYKDMRHPRKYGKALKITFGFTYVLDMSMAVVGLLMFGDAVRDEITRNILLTNGYPRALSICIVVFIAIIPLTKIPLNARPIFSTLEIYSGVDARAISPAPGFVGLSGISRGILKISLRIFTLVVIIAIAIVVPSFDRIMALMGSALCFTICIILPLAFHLKLFGKEISVTEKVMNWFLIGLCTLLAIIGTVWAFLPRDRIGAV